MSKLLSIVVPCYNEEEVLPLFCEKVGEITASLKKDKDIDTEYIFVDDGSSDHTLDLMRQYHLKDGRIHYISFSRNFGKEAGLYAGLKEAKGDFVVVMDADLQDPPTLLPMTAVQLEESHVQVNQKYVPSLPDYSTSW